MRYDNDIMIKKIIEKETHLSSYHPEKVKIQKFPQLEKARMFKTDFRESRIHKENLVKFN